MMINPGTNASEYPHSDWSEYDLASYRLHKLHPALKENFGDVDLHGDDAPAYRRGLPKDWRSVLVDPARLLRAIEQSEFKTLSQWIKQTHTKDDKERKWPTDKTRVKIGTRFICTIESLKGVAAELDVKSWMDLVVHDEATHAPFQEHSNTLRDLVMQELLLGDELPAGTNVYPLIVKISKEHDRLNHWVHSPLVVNNVVEKLTDHMFLAKNHAEHYYTIAEPDLEQAKRFAASRLASELSDIRLMIPFLKGESNRTFKTRFISSLKDLVEECEKPEVLRSGYHFRRADHQVHAHIAGFGCPPMMEKAITNVKLHDGILLSWRCLLSLEHGKKSEERANELMSFNTLQARDHRDLFNELDEPKIGIKKIEKILRRHSDRYLWLWEQVQELKDRLG